MKIPINLSVEKKQLQELQREGKAQYCTVQHIIRELIKQFLKKP